MQVGDGATGAGHWPRGGGGQSSRGDVWYIPYRGTSLARKRSPLEPYRRLMPRVLGGFYGGGRFLMGEVPL